VVLVVGGAAWAEEAKTKRPLRYEGKTFEQWRDELDEEIAPRRRIETIKALTAFGVRGRADDATRVLLKLTEEYRIAERKGDLGNLGDFLDEAQVPAAVTKAFERLGERSAPVFRQVLRDPRSPLRRTAAWTAFGSKSRQLLKQIKEELAALFDDDDDELRKGATSALWYHLHDGGELGEEQSVLLRGTYSKRVETRTTAIRLLGKKGGRLEVVVPRLLEMLSEYHDDETVKDVLRTVAEIGPKAVGAKAAVIAVLQGPILAKGKWDLLDDVAEALGKLKVQDERAAALLRRATRHYLLTTESSDPFFTDERPKRLRAVTQSLEGRRPADSPPPIR
jgi:hypothetical protein